MKTPKLDLVGSAEAAQELHVDRSTFLRWVKAGKISPAMAGNGKTGEKFFSREDIDALAAEVAAKRAPKSVAS